MKDRQPTKKNPYILPHNVYMQTLYLIRDYDRMVEEYNAILIESPLNDGQPSANTKSSSVESKTLRRDTIEKKIRAVENALKKIPDEYRNAVFRNVAYRIPFPLAYTSVRTWSMWRCRFVYLTSKEVDKM